MTKRPLVLIGLATALVLLQQHLLLRRAPRLNTLETQQVQSGTAALDLQFSRPMNREQLAAESSIQPSLSFRWLGDSKPDAVLLIAAEQRVTGTDPAFTESVRWPAGINGEISRPWPTRPGGGIHGHGWW